MYPICEELPASVKADDDEARKRELAKQAEKKKRQAEEREDRESN